MASKIRIKTKEDIAILREGGKRHAHILRSLAAMVKPGVSTLDLENEARRLIEEGNAMAGATVDASSFLNFQSPNDHRPFPAALCVSINDEVVHGIPNENPRTLAEGDIVTLDFGLVHKGLITDAAVTVPVGNVTPELTALMETTKRALMAGIKAAKGGDHVGDIGQAIELVGLGATSPDGKGYGIVEELVGHGVGYSVHEPPFIPNYGEVGKGELLKPGMVIAIEPIFNLGKRHIKLDNDGYTYRTRDGKPSAHFEHTVLITKGGAEILTA